MYGPLHPRRSVTSQAGSAETISGSPVRRTALYACAVATAKASAYAMAWRALTAAAIDAHAARLGLSRNEYLRRRLRQDAQVAGDRAVRAEDLKAFADLFRDLADPSVMRDAWS